MIAPGSPAWRRRAAIAFLGLGGLAAARSLSRDLPHEQTLVFRLSETDRRVPLTLHASVTRVGESEARGGFSVTRAGGEPSDPRQTLQLPNGEYVVTADWTYIGSAAQTAASKQDETSRVERVTLSGGEITVPLAPRARE